MPTNEDRIKHLQRIADGQQDIAIVTVQFYDEDDTPTDPRVVGWCEIDDLAKAMWSVAESYQQQDIDALVGYVNGREASQEHWNALIDYLHAERREDELEDVCHLRGLMDAHGASFVRPRASSWLPEDWEEVAMSPDLIVAHPARPTGGDASCETCGGSGVVAHPFLGGYYGDCPDCGSGDIMM